MAFVEAVYQFSICILFRSVFREILELVRYKVKYMGKVCQAFKWFQLPRKLAVVVDHWVRKEKHYFHLEILALAHEN